MAVIHKVLQKEKKISYLQLTLLPHQFLFKEEESWIAANYCMKCKDIIEKVKIPTGISLMFRSATSLVTGISSIKIQRIG